MVTGLLIKHLRIAKDLKQANVAKRLGISQQAYSKLENGQEVDTHRLSDILKAMDSTEEDLNEIRQLFTLPPQKNE